MHLEKESLKDASMDCYVNGASSNDRSCTHLKVKVKKYLQFLESALWTLTLYGVDERDWGFASPWTGVKVEQASSGAPFGVEDIFPTAIHIRMTYLVTIISRNSKHIRIRYLITIISENSKNIADILAAAEHIRITYFCHHHIFWSENIGTRVKLEQAASIWSIVHCSILMTYLP